MSRTEYASSANSSDQWNPRSELRFSYGSQVVVEYEMTHAKLPKRTHLAFQWPSWIFVIYLRANIVSEIHEFLPHTEYYETDIPMNRGWLETNESEGDWICYDGSLQDT